MGSFFFFFAKNIFDSRPVFERNIILLFFIVRFVVVSYVFFFYKFFRRAEITERTEKSCAFLPYIQGGRRVFTRFRRVVARGKTRLFTLYTRAVYHRVRTSAGACHPLEILALSRTFYIKINALYILHIVWAVYIHVIAGCDLWIVFFFFWPAI